MAISADIIQQQRAKFYRQLPNMGFAHSNRYEVRQQGFISELDPNGHLINDRIYYPDIVKKKPIQDKDGNDTGNFETLITPIERVAIPMQKVILEKHLTHLCGDNIKFTNHNLKPTDKEHDIFSKFKQGWEKKNMETAKYEFCRSIKATGDGAFCASVSKGKFGYRVFSILNGDTLHPIYDDKGDLKLFGRSFNTYDYATQEQIVKMEVWDDTHVTVFSYRTDDKFGSKGTITWGASDFAKLQSSEGLYDGWQLESAPTKHGFQSIPIVYLKDEDGACWSHVQPLIEKLEMALSQLAENNKHYAFRIMVVKGDVEVQGDWNGEARAMAFDDKDGDAKFLEKADASSSFDLQLAELNKLIQQGASIVLDTDKVSGDLSGIAMKIRYSPAIEQALNDKHLFNSSIDKMVDLFKEGYGIELGQITDFANLDLRGDIQPYVHQSETELYNQMIIGKNGGFLSTETITETVPHAAADELNRLKREQQVEDERQLDLERQALMGSLKKQTNPLGDGMNDKNLERKIVASSE